MIDMLLPMLGIKREALPSEEQLTDLIAELRALPQRLENIEASLARLEAAGITPKLES